MKNPLIQIQTDDNRVVIANEGYHLLDKLLTKPLRKSLSITALDAQSFISLSNEYKQDLSKLFYTDDELCLVVDPSSKDEASFAEQRIGLKLTRSSFYLTFEKALDKRLSQKDCVMLLKSLYPFITKADGAPIENMDVIELATSLQAVKTFHSVVDNARSAFSLDISIKGSNDKKESINLPRTLEFELPVFSCSSLKAAFEAELFVSVDSDGGFSLTLSSFTKDIKFKALLDKVVDDIKAKVSTPAFYGVYEA